MWVTLSECLSLNADVLRFDNSYSLVHSKHINSTVEVLLTDQTFVEKTERSWANLVAPTASPLISGSTVNSQPSLARPPPTSPGMGILQQLLPAHLSQWVCVLGPCHCWDRVPVARQPQRSNQNTLSSWDLRLSENSRLFSMSQYQVMSYCSNT